MLQRLCQNLASHILFIGKREQSSMPVSSDKSTVAHNYVRKESFCNFLPRHATELRERPIRILSLGGLSKIKGGAELSRLADEIRPFAEVRLVGVSPSDIPKNGIAAETVPPTIDVIPHLEWADVLVFWTSTPHFPRPVFEAWLARRIVIVSACISEDSGIDESCAIVGSDQSYKALRDAVQQVIDSPEDALSRAELGFARATEEFTERNFEAIAQALRKFIRKAQ
jgi:glycosyltransferase involved in cell wall biosynthesis